MYPTAVSVSRLFLAAVVVSVTAVGADDWPQWRGVGRLGVLQETGIIDTFPDAGLKVTWRVPVRSGFAGPAVAGGRVFVLDWQEDPQSRTLDGTERLLALDEQSGAVLWTHEWDTSYRDGCKGRMRWVRGQRQLWITVACMSLGAAGMLRCLDVESGDLIWQKDYIEDYDTSVSTWGIASAPLVDGDRLIAVVGGEPDALVVAFNKHTGEELWRAVEVVGEMGLASR